MSPDRSPERSPAPNSPLNKSPISPKSSVGRPATVLSSKLMSFEEMEHIPYIISETKFKRQLSGQHKYNPTEKLPEKKKLYGKRKSTADMSVDDSIGNILSSQIESSSIGIDLGF